MKERPECRRLSLEAFFSPPAQTRLPYSGLAAAGRLSVVLEIRHIRLVIDLGSRGADMGNFSNISRPFVVKSKEKICFV